MKSTLALLLATLLLTPLQAADPAPPDGFRAIFNGQDLTGWYGLNPHAVAKLEGEKREANLKQQREEFPQHWRVGEGGLVNARPRPHATTEEEFGRLQPLIE